MSSTRKHSPHASVNTVDRDIYTSDTIAQAARTTSHTYLTRKRPGSRTTVRRTPGHHVSTKHTKSRSRITNSRCSRKAQICASVTFQGVRILRATSPPPHRLRRGMSPADPCCSHNVRQRGCGRVLTWQRDPRGERQPLALQSPGLTLLSFGSRKAFFLKEASKEKLPL